MLGAIFGKKVSFRTISILKPKKHTRVKGEKTMDRTRVFILKHIFLVPPKIFWARCASRFVFN